VLRSVYLPVMTVGPEAHLPVDRGEERVVLHATTLRETSRPSAALACQVAAAQKAKLILLHVLPSISEMERKGLPAGMRSSAMLELRILAAQTGADCCSAIEPVVAHGNPTIEILALAAERRASLIVLSATRRPAFEDITRDRTAVSYTHLMSWSFHQAPLSLVTITRVFWSIPSSCTVSITRPIIASTSFT